MDFSNRGSQPQPAAPAGPQFNAGASNKKAKASGGGRLSGIAQGVVVVAVVLLLVSLVVWLLSSAFGGPKSEDSYVDQGKLQAVFLNTGQVYFGNIKTLNNKYLVLGNIYYLQTTSTGQQQQQNANVSLVKLGCELHEPYDQMVINRDQVTFWENLQDGGQVAKAVKTFEQQNPNGQKCADQSQAPNTQTNVQGSSNSNGAATTTPTTSTTKKP